MNNYFSLAAVLAGGFATGIFFFGALWVTVRKGLTARIPALWFAVSFLIRAGVAMTCFYFLMDGVWSRGLSCLVGFLIGRMVVTRFTRTLNEPPKQEMV